MTLVEPDNHSNYTENLTKILLQPSRPLVKSIRKTKNNKKVCLKLLDNVKVARSQGKAAFNSWKKLEFPSEGIAHDTRVLLMIPTTLNEKSTDRNYVIFWNNVKPIRLENYTTPQILMKNYFGNF